MDAIFGRLEAWRARCLLLAVLALGVTGAFAVPALAAPSWGITMTHHNPYGLQVASCPGEKESLEPLCGVDPFSGNGTSFARESGFNAYTIKVENKPGG